jgi:bifunctional UDP-N-acetylglucosamine pyrophosphorylase/glucosamine-1-phosphate N-acetyltransferase
MLNEHISNAYPISVMTTVTKDPTNYGRIILDEAGFIRAIVEEKDATPEQRQITEVNAGIYCVERNFLLTALKNIGTENKQQEYYLTDIVTTAHSTGLKVNRFFSREADELLGVNSRQELSLAHAIHQKRFLCQLMGQGVTCILPETITIGGNVQIGRDTVISSHVVITGQSIIGDGCYIAPFSCLRDCRLGHNVVVGEFSYLNGITLGDNESVLPCSRIHKNIFQKQHEGV